MRHAGDRLAEELETRGEYVATVSLNSPGGSVEDAMTMGKLLRENDVSTEVADGARLKGERETIATVKASKGCTEPQAIVNDQQPEDERKRMAERAAQVAYR